MLAEGLIPDFYVFQVLRWRSIAKCGEPSPVFVVDPPIFDRISRLFQIVKEILIQTLISQLSIKALKVRVFHGFSGPDELKLSKVFKGPTIYAFPENSDPLSEGKAFESPRVFLRRSKTRITSIDRSPKSTSIATLSRLK